MRSRMKRDKVTGVRRVVIVARESLERHGGPSGYAVRGYAHYAAKPEHVYYYHLRRDGRVARSWGPVPDTRVLEWGTPLLLA
jgi:hypothetical protein